MATITPQSGSGALTYAAATSGGDTFAFATATRPVILVRNAAGSSITVTLTGVVPCSQGSLHNVPVVCAVGDTEIVPPAQVIDTTTANRGNVLAIYSSVTSVTVAAVAS